MKVSTPDSIECRLDEFLKHPTKRVLVIKGRWGVGKTYFWTNHFMRHRFPDVARFNEGRYTYVSLFGLGSVDEIEQLILTNSRKIGNISQAGILSRFLCSLAQPKSWFFRQCPELAGKCKSVSNRLLRKQNLSLLFEIPGLAKWKSLFPRLSRIFVDNTLICLDDLERKSPTLSVRNVLGLVSVLREQNNCRIVLIMNEDELEDNDQKALDLYREKAIDETITYEPEVRHNIALIFEKSTDLTPLIDVFQRLEMNNIRVMQQTAWSLEYFASYMKGLEPVVQKQLCEHVAMLACFYHVRSLGVDVNKMPRDSWFEYQFKLAGNEKDSEEKQQDKLLFEKYGYSPQQYDPFVIDFLQHGTCDDEQFGQALNEVNEREKKDQILTKHREVWASFRNNFKLDGSVVAQRIVGFLNTYSFCLNIKELHELIQFLRTIGAKEQADQGEVKWKNAFVEARIDRSDGKHLEELACMTSNPVLLSKIGLRRQTVSNSVPIVRTLKKVIEDSGWSQEIVAQLNACKVEEYQREFEVSDDEHLLECLHDLCDSWRKTEQSEECKVVEKIKTALMAISKTSKINERRVRMVIPWAFTNGATASTSAEQKS